MSKPKHRKVSSAAPSIADLQAQVGMLVRELEEAQKQQSATTEVLQVINSSPGDLAPVFDAMLDKALSLCEASFGVLCTYDGDSFRAAALRGVPARYAEFLRSGPLRPGPGNGLSRLVAGERVVHVLDVAAEGTYRSGEAMRRALVDLGGARTTVTVPLLKDNKLLGAFIIFRQDVRPFTEKQIALAQNFAAQAVIAIENAGLLSELRQRTDDLSKSLEDLRTAQDRLVQTQKLASLGQLTAGIAHEIKNPLNFVNNFSCLSVELIDEMCELLERVTADEKTRQDISELAEMLRDNLDKIVRHGRRADAIVKNMLLHSREGSGERRSAEINRLVEESLNLAYHGARAEKANFSITLKHELDPDAGALDLYPQEMTRALLNLISNGFYAATRRKVQAGDDSFEPVLSAATRNLGSIVEIRIRDNGIGISPEVREKMFNPFFTTKPTGEGTGLGLSMTHDIIVKQHGGSIDVETEPGAFTEFVIRLPRGNGSSSRKLA